MNEGQVSVIRQSFNSSYSEYPFPLDRSTANCWNAFTFAKSVYSYGRLPSHNKQHCGLLTAAMLVRCRNNSGAKVTRALLHRGGGGAPVTGEKEEKKRGLRSAIRGGYIALPRISSRWRGRMLIQADHWHPRRPITISVSLTAMPKAPWLLNEAKPLKDLAGSPPASWFESKL